MILSRNIEMNQDKLLKLIKHSKLIINKTIRKRKMQKFNQQFYKSLMFKWINEVIYNQTYKFNNLILLFMHFDIVHSFIFSNDSNSVVFPLAILSARIFPAIPVRATPCPENP